MNRETCYHCELDPTRRQWLDRYSFCGLCKIQRPAPAYHAGRVRGILVGLFPTKGKGIRYASDVALLVDRLDIEGAILALVKDEVLQPIEANVVVWRFVKQKTVEAVASAIGCSESTAKRASRSALVKIRDFLNADSNPG